MRAGIARQRSDPTPRAMIPAPPRLRWITRARAFTLERVNIWLPRRARRNRKPLWLWKQAWPSRRSARVLPRARPEPLHHVLQDTPRAPPRINERKRSALVGEQPGRQREVQVREDLRDDLVFGDDGNRAKSSLLAAWTSSCGRSSRLARWIRARPRLRTEACNGLESAPCESAKPPSRHRQRAPRCCRASPHRSARGARASWSGDKPPGRPRSAARGVKEARQIAAAASQQAAGMKQMGDAMDHARRSRNGRWCQATGSQVLNLSALARQLNDKVTAYQV